MDQMNLNTQETTNYQEQTHSAQYWDPPPPPRTPKTQQFGIDLIHDRWKTWRGPNRIYCKGKLVTGPSSEQLSVLSSHLLLVYIFTIWYLFYNPILIQHGFQALSYFIICFWLISYLSLLKCQFTDPGILNKEVEYLEKDQQLAKEGDYFYENTLIYKPRYCSTCNIIRPPKASHCSICDHCVRVFDHHCTFINNCVGVRNMRPFVTLVMSAAVLGGLLVVSGIAYGWYVGQQEEMNGGQEEGVAGMIGPIGSIKSFMGVMMIVTSLVLCYLFSSEQQTQTKRTLSGLGSLATFYLGILIISFPHITTDFCLPQLLGFTAFLFSFLIKSLVKRYIFLISRGWTEKEKEARKKKQLEMPHIEDKAMQSVGYGEWYKNWKYFILEYKQPESIFTVYAEEKTKVS
ncbi:hypothetical protein FGO68_gene2770 [Halteria grandinella]|uniref:Palmitoyltransferase n=1 Tax=Halteria grandinella TaxID=5974 RepID=A0A8J8NWQ0_HALGN|nr:hypothetical protein FGO68_gene2770 [Halteria grandinella]